MKKISVLSLLIFLMGVFGIYAAGQQDKESKIEKYPSKAIQFIVPAGAGGGTDLSARLLGKYLEKELGVPIVVTNVKGAGGSLGTRQAKDAQPDGYTLSYYNEGTILNKLTGVAEYGMEAFELAGVPLIVDATVLCTSKKIKSFNECIAEAQKNPGKLRVGVETGTYTPLMFTLIQNQKGIKYQLVDTGSLNDSIASLMGGHVDMIQSPLGIVKDYISSGEFNAVAVLSEKRTDFAPEIPTLKELGVDFVLPKYYYLGFPKGTPVEIQEKFRAALKKVVLNPDFKKEATAMNFTVAPELVDADAANEFIRNVEKVFARYQEEMKNIEKDIRIQKSEKK
mgnify:CR=1 FL=1